MWQAGRQAVSSAHFQLNGEVTVAMASESQVTAPPTQAVGGGLRTDRSTSRARCCALLIWHPSWWWICQITKDAQGKAEVASHNHPL